MKIAITSGGLLKSSGVDRTVFELARCLSEKHDITIFTIGGYVDDELRNVMNDKGVVIRELPYGKIKIFRRYSLLKYSSLFKDTDAVISSDPVLGNAAVLSNAPMVKIYYGHGLFFSSILRNPLEWLAGVIEDTPQVRKSFNMAISRYAENELRKIYGTDVMSMTSYPGIDMNMFKRSGKRIKLDHNYILYVGSINPSKRIDLVIRAYLMSDAQDTHLYIVGKTHDMGYYKKLKVMSDSRINFVGTVPFFDLPKWYRGAEFVVNGTHYDYFSLPLVEAQACAVPVVAFNRAAIPEVVLDNKTGFLVNDTEMFSLRINMLLYNKNARGEMGKEAERWARNFTWKRTAKNYDDVLERVGRN